MPVSDESIDVALVNGIFNLNPKRDEIFKELARVVRKGRSVYAAELIVQIDTPVQKVCKISDWFA